MTSERAAEIVVSDDRKPHPGRRLTWEEFLEWSTPSTFAEWEDREVILASPASRDHSDLVQFLSMVVGYFVLRYDLGKVHLDPFTMHLPTRPSGRQPDLMFVSKEQLHISRPISWKARQTWSSRSFLPTAFAGTKL